MATHILVDKYGANHLVFLNDTNFWQSENGDDTWNSIADDYWVDKDGVKHDAYDFTSVSELRKQDKTKQQQRAKTKKQIFKDALKENQGVSHYQMGRSKKRYFYIVNVNGELFYELHLSGLLVADYDKPKSIRDILIMLAGYAQLGGATIANLKKSLKLISGNDILDIDSKDFSDDDFIKHSGVDYVCL